MENYTFNNVPRSVLERIAERMRDRAERESFDCGPNSYAENLARQAKRIDNAIKLSDRVTRNACR